MSTAAEPGRFMLRIRCAAVLGAVAASLLLAATATATPATPTITATQTSALTMKLTASTGTRWTWTFLDANGAAVGTSNVNPVTQAFAVPGNYTAMVDATDNDPVLTAPPHGQTTFHVYAKPVADFTATQQADGTVTFSDTSTNEPTAWTWTFPSGTFKGQTPPAQVLPVGSSTVSLKVTNPAGNANVSRTIVVNGPPVPVLNILSSPAGINSAVLLDAGRSTDPNGDPLTFSWDLNGDGVYGDGSGSLETVSYAAPGTYRVGVQVSDNHGAMRTAEGAITVVADQAPTVDFTNDPTSPMVDGLITFTAKAADADGTVTKIEWDLDDDGAFDDASGTHATWWYPNAGWHRVAVRATDDRGVATVVFRSVGVEARPPANTTDQSRDFPASGPSPQSSASGTAIPNVPAPSSTRTPLLAPFPVVRIRGQIFRGSVVISLLRVQAPAGATIRVRCRGGSCADKRSDLRVKAARVPLRVKRLEHRALRAGTVVEVFVTAPRVMGKYVRFRVRDGATPSRVDLCLPAGRTKPTACPTS